MDFSSELVRGSVVPVVLALLREKPMYGYEMVKLVNARTNGLFEWREGTLYPTLHRLEAERLIKAKWQAGESGKRRKYYMLTRRGQSELAKRAEEWQQFAGAMNMLLAKG
ncbi:PadR family transcriptional regulator [Phycisphaerales bacterium AB-hyl4]|uniref:PadR family transcriptional regulator n=1 Tax=Natronomicrosphaera hydrolytica TaxID=3242702 RepID=A0ABV4U8T4_9BACT